MSLRRTAGGWSKNVWIRSPSYLLALDNAASDARSAFDKTTDEHLLTQLAIARSGTGRHASAASPDDSGHDQSLVASPRTDDRLSASDGRQSSLPFWTISRRQSVSITRINPSSSLLTAEGGRRLGSPFARLRLSEASKEVSLCAKFWYKREQRAFEGCSIVFEHCVAESQDKTSQ